MVNNLGLLATERSSDTQRRAGKLCAELKYGHIDEILATGLHAYLTQFLDRVNDIGAGPLRELRGRDEVRALLLWWFDFFDGNCRQELIDVCASDDRVIEVLHELGEKDGRVFDNVAIYVFEIDPQDPDRFARVRTYDRDRANIEEFWSHHPDVVNADAAGLLAPFLPTEDVAPAPSSAAAHAGGR